ncbi:MAG: hypothetical protein KDB20_03325, partial [Microthrixaceae bacterium]|nr:hypothetical protein [Microthrixaceae bacterium]
AETAPDSGWFYLGDNELVTTVSPIALPGDTAAITAGVYHACATSTTGAITCWGNGEGGRLGYGDT